MSDDAPATPDQEPEGTPDQEPAVEPGDGAEPADDETAASEG